MPGLDGIAVTELLAGRGVPDPIAVVVITTFDLDEYVHGALRAGPRGFLLKDAAAILRRVPSNVEDPSSHKNATQGGIADSQRSGRASCNGTASAGTGRRASGERSGARGRVPPAC